MAEITIQTLNWRKWPEFAPTWERIHGLCTDASFFLSRAWLNCWLTTYGPELKPELLAFVNEGEVVACCLLVWRFQWVRGIPLRRVYLNCDGENAADTTYLEFNSLLSVPEYAKPAAEALANLLRGRYWDEFLLAGTVNQAAIQTLSGAFRNNETSEVSSRYVDFRKLREKRSSFLNHVSSKTRYHIRRTQREYEQVGGACTLHVAGSVDEALEMLQQLADLHQARWEGRGKSGAFNSAKFFGFHKTLIQQEFDRVLLFRLQAGDKIVGLLYCFIHRGWVYYYQSGISYTVAERGSPGLLTLYYAIDYCLARAELDGFDFMAGDSEYKRSLTAPADYNILRWMVIRRQSLPSLLYQSLRSVKRRYSHLMQQDQSSRETTPGD